MESPVQHFLRAFPPHHTTTERWPIQGEMTVRLALGEAFPPTEASSSILSIVLNADGQILYLWPSDPSGSIAHFLIGGRPEGRETPIETAIREVGEETGWLIEPKCQIGFRHFHQPGPRAAKTDRPYPDFIQPIFAALAVRYERRRLVAGDQIPAEFLAFAEAEQLTDPPQRPLLLAARDVVRSFC